MLPATCFPKASYVSGENHDQHKLPGAEQEQVLSLLCSRTGGASRTGRQRGVVTAGNKPRPCEMEAPTTSEWTRRLWDKEAAMESEH